MREGRIIKGIGGFYYIDYDGITYECKARGIFRKNKMTPMVGDYVVFSVTDEEKLLGMIEEIKERETELIRPPVANVDQAIVVFAITQPDPNLALLDRFIVLAESQRLEIAICINKIDLADEEEQAKLKKIYEATGYPVIFTTKENKASIDEIKKLLAGKTTVFAGPSGVGKSTLLNRIQSNLVLQTGEISAKNARGKHTTRHVELIPLQSSGWVVDTPGFSSLTVDFMEVEELSDTFREFDEYREGCQYLSCIHENEPRCGVKTAVEEGDIPQSRYTSYLQLLEEIRKNRRY
ncbi:ribosome small subunit-dependent GTPase A [Alkaliphilus hydrothermalis]|uniref:Small ribosomal subunit biogenesis GTPase RsgA n=1 Tax=Alkaliphilus hydrothermalis TaxID=1482730 RepID=A0ABS2NSA4_9FIRM|nr:ribosome small subunit-dependent GTPase A [Alkaliphilus hydrothermalis]MBM7615844.1 ribosome biogenesis GTPase [Alkaliphilus hydrothermalis]